MTNDDDPTRRRAQARERARRHRAQGEPLCVMSSLGGDMRRCRTRKGANRDAESELGRIRILRAEDGAAKPSSDDLFASGLDQPFGIAFYPSGSDPQWVYVANTGCPIPLFSGDLKARGKAGTWSGQPWFFAAAPTFRLEPRAASPTQFRSWVANTRRFLPSGSENQHGRTVGLVAPRAADTMLRFPTHQMFISVGSASNDGANAMPPRSHDLTDDATPRQELEAT